MKKYKWSHQITRETRPQLDIFIPPRETSSARNRLLLLKSLAKRAPWKSPKHLRLMPTILVALHKLMIRSYR